MRFLMSLLDYLVNPQRTSHITGLNQNFASALERMIAAAPEGIRGNLGLLSGFRSVDRQRELFNQAVKKYGSERAARKWVAPAGKSKHNHGGAMDLRYADPRARKWAHANASRFNLNFPMSHEPWHIELSKNAGGGAIGVVPGTPVEAPKPVSGPGVNAPFRGLPGAPNVPSEAIGVVPGMRDVPPANSPLGQALANMAAELTKAPAASRVSGYRGRNSDFIIPKSEDPFALFD